MASLPAGLETRPLTGRRLELEQLFAGHTCGVMEVTPGGWVFPKTYEAYAKKLKEFEFEEGDVLVDSYQKSGSTWVQEVIWTLRNNPDLDNPMAAVPLYERSPYFEGDIILQMTQPEMPKELLLDLVRESDRPRTIKSHLSFDLLSPTLLEKAKVVYLVRDPRDVCVSQYYHDRLFKNQSFKGTFDQFVEIMLSDVHIFGPYWTSVKEAWRRRDHPNLLIMSYDRLKADSRNQIKRLADFVGAKVTDEQLEKVVHHTSFAQMKGREDNVITAHQKDKLMNLDVAAQDGGLFFKKGESGRHKEALTQAHQQRFAAWVAANCPDQELKTLLNF